MEWRQGKWEEGGGVVAWRGGEEYWSTQPQDTVSRATAQHTTSPPRHPSVLLLPCAPPAAIVPPFTAKYQKSVMGPAAGDCRVGRAVSAGGLDAGKTVVDAHPRRRGVDARTGRPGGAGPRGMARGARGNPRPADELRALG